MSLKLLTAGLASFVLASLALTACTSTEPEADISAALMARPWKISSATAAPGVTVNGHLITNVLDSMQSDCDAHTIVRYLSRDSLAVSTDSIGCGSGHGTWTRSGNVVTTTFNKDSGPETTAYTVLSVSSTQLTMTWVASASQSPDSIPHTVTEVYLAQ